jgi:hypothetical protein
VRRLGAAASCKLRAMEDEHTLFGGEENEIDICITEEAKPRMGRQFWSSVGRRLQAFQNPFLVWVPFFIPVGDSANFNNSTHI